MTFNETSHILPVITHPEVPEKCPTLTAKMQGQTGWAPYNETSHLLPVAFTQNQRDELRVLGDKVGALSASHGTHQTNYIAQPIEGFDRYNIALTGDISHTLVTSSSNSVPMVLQPDPVVFNIREDAKANTFHCKPVEVFGCVTALRPSPMGHHAQEFIVQPIPIQDGREIEKKQNGLGIGEPGDKAYTLDTTGAQAVAQPKKNDE